jgi:replicative DNA helicase
MTLNNHGSPTASAKKLTIWTQWPTTTGGCLAGDTLLMHASNGWPVALRDLVRRRNGTVLTMRDASVLAQQAPAAYLAYEPAQLYQLTTYTGRHIEATAEHPFLTRDGWKPLSELCPSDNVAVVAEYPQLFGHGDTDAELAKLLAYLTANGTNCDGTAPPIADPYVLADFEAAVQAKEDECVLLEGDADPRRLFVRGPAGTRSKILRYMDIVGIHGVQPHEKFVPDFIFGLRQDKLRLYLNRLFTCDGVVETSGRITYRTPSERMARQVQHLLTRFGVVCLLRGLQGHGGLEAVDLFITTKSDVLRFIDDIGFIGEKAGRAEQLRASLYQVRTIEPAPDRLGPILFDRVYMVERTRSAEVYDLAIADSHNFVANDFIVRTSSWGSLVASGCAELIDDTTDVDRFDDTAKESVWRPSDTRADELERSR